MFVKKNMSCKKLILCATFLISILPIFIYKNRFVDKKSVYHEFSISSTTECSATDCITTDSSKSKYLVANAKCKILDINPFDFQIQTFFHPEQYFPCSKDILLTYLTKIHNTATLHINYDIVPSYTINNVSCCYSNITRKQLNDNQIRISRCVEFKEKVVMNEDFVFVTCKDTETKKKVYGNTHAAITVNKEVKKKIIKFNSSVTPYSVLFVGIDSISRLNFIRNLPNTFQYVEHEGWLSLKGYNKIADNTFPNVMAILTGFNENSSFTTCDPTTSDKLDQCPMIWYNYRKLGYITGYAEDESAMGTFNVWKKGFTQPPTDYYFRPYILGSEKLKITRKDGMNYCTGPELAGERVLNIAKDFVVTFKDYPTFSLFWINTFSHNELNSPSGMDLKIKNFLKEISSDVLDNSFIFFLSDHGMRFGEGRYTYIGWLEERLPFIYVSVPERFKAQYPVEFKNFKNQQHRLTNPYDIYMTLQHILVLSGFNHTIKASEACPKCKSLFLEGDSDRSCEDAAIEQHWCTCADYSPISPNDKTVKEASQYLINEIQEIINDRDSDEECAKYNLSQIKVSSISETFTYKNDTYFLLVIETQPKAVFEATILYKEEMFQLMGGISRLDAYSTHSHCVDDAYLKKYCHCLDNYY